ncbi:MAG TPA: hypothetical protein VN420_04280 [Candidatus Fimivivens sp.]|nr:hypothetical protein [Candidatus Fimivivens sp.]
MRSGIARDFIRLLLGVEDGRKTVVTRSTCMVIAIAAIIGYINIVP